jgi:hypothetical protein
VKEKVKVGFLLLAFFAACFFVTVTYRFVREELIVDRCLSGNHGSFNYSNMTCDLETNHPYVSYRVRHPRDKRSAALSLGSFVAFLSGAFFLRTDRKKT